MRKSILLITIFIFSTLFIPTTIAQIEDNNLQRTMPSVLTASFLNLYYNHEGNIEFSWSQISGTTQFRIFNGSLGSDTILATFAPNGTSWTYFNAEVGKTYCFGFQRIFSNVFGSGGEGFSTCIITVAPPVETIPPNAPLNLEVTIEGSNFDTIKLTWDAPNTTTTASISGYKLFRSTDPNVEFSLLTNITDPTIQVWEDIPASKSDLYYYRVYANSEAGLSTYASASAGAPTVPLNFEAVSESNNIRLSWDEPSGDSKSSIIKYQLYRSSNLSEAFQAIANLTVDLYIDTNIGAGQNYYYKVSAMNLFGTGKNASVSIIFPGLVPEDLPDLFTTIAKDRQVQLIWNNPSDGSSSNITGYEIYRSASLQGRFDLIASIASTQAPSQNYTDDELTNGQTYYYLLYSVNSIGASNSYLVQVATPATLPDAPNSLKATIGSAQVTLSWDVPTDNGGLSVTEYLIHRSQNFANFQFVGSTKSLFYIDDTIMDEKIYEYRVYAKNSLGTSSSFASIDVFPSGIISTEEITDTSEPSSISTISFTIPNLISNTSTTQSSLTSSSLPTSSRPQVSFLITSILGALLLQIACVILIQSKKKRFNRES